MGNRVAGIMQHPIFVLLSEQEWRRVIILLALTILLTVAELAGIGGTGLLIQVASDPDSVARIPYIPQVFDWFGIGEGSERLIATLGALMAVILFRNVIAMVVLWWRLLFLNYARRDLATRLLRSYLFRPYSYFLRHNSAMMSKTVLVETKDLVSQYIFAWVTLVTDGLMLLATLGFLFYIEPVVTLICGGVVGVLGFLVTYGLRSRLQNLGRQHRALNEEMFRVTNESMAGIKEVKVLGRELSFTNKFFKSASHFAQVSVRYMLYTDGPRYALEIIAVVGFFIFVVVAMHRTDSIAEVAGLLGAFGFALYRILPVAHRLVSAVGGLNFNRAIVKAISEAITFENNAQAMQSVDLLPMQNSVELRDVSYCYENSDSNVLHNINLNVRQYESIGIVGQSGAGKSTLVDVLIGLLPPSSGALVIDGNSIDGEQVSGWQRNIGYVPQGIHLLDDTIRQNIALGLLNKEIEEDRIWQAIDSAQLRDLIDSLPMGLDTVIGERGVRVSGGQRQRIGIARALYHKASVLVLDEATSALDNKTEAEVRQSIEALKGKLTLIVIAHRLTTVRACDRILVMDAGSVVAEGDFETLERESEYFRGLLNAGTCS